MQGGRKKANPNPNPNSFSAWAELVWRYLLDVTTPSTRVRFPDLTLENITLSLTLTPGRAAAEHPKGGMDPRIQGLTLTLLTLLALTLTLTLASKALP